MGKPTKAQIEEDIKKGYRNKQGELYPSKKKKPGKNAKPGVKRKRRRNQLPVVKKPVGGDKRSFNYKIVNVVNKNEHSSESYGFRKYNDALTKLQQLKELSDKVRFPSKYSSMDTTKEERVFETLLLKKKDGTENTYIKNEYGKNIEHIITNKNTKWAIIDKFKKNVEEKFWVFGYDNRYERKDFYFILNEIILFNVEDDFFFKYVIVYNNKLIIKYIDNDCDIVICKCHDDAIRLYSELLKEVNERKIKNVLFNGTTRRSSLVQDTVIQNNIEELLMKKTGWSLAVVRRNKTSPH